MYDIEWKDMSIDGQIVSGDALHVAFGAFMRGLPEDGCSIGSHYLQGELKAAGVPPTVVRRVAGRVLQKARRAGVVKNEGGKWRRCVWQ